MDLTATIWGLFSCFHTNRLNKTCSPSYEHINNSFSTVASGHFLSSDFQHKEIRLYAQQAMSVQGFMLSFCSLLTRWPMFSFYREVLLVIIMAKMKTRLNLGKFLKICIPDLRTIHLHNSQVLHESHAMRWNFLNI